MIILLVIAVVLVSAPLIAVGAVSIAVFREESMHSLIGRAPGPIAHGARRVLAFQSEASCEPFSQADAGHEPMLGGRAAGGETAALGHQPLFPFELPLPEEPVVAGGRSPWWADR